MQRTIIMLAVPVAASLGMQADVPRWQRAPAPACTTSQTTVTLASAALVETVGLEFAQVQAAPLMRTIERNAEVAYNANRYARLSSRAAGVVAEVLKDLGEPVKKGEAVAVVDSSELGAAKADLLQARALVNLWQSTAARERALLEKGVGIERHVLEAETTLAESRITLARTVQRLRNLGLTKDQIETVEAEADTSSLLTVVAPFDGLVVERAAVMGEVVEPRTMLLAIADTRLMWAMVDLVETDLAIVQAGQSVELSIEGLRPRTFAGRLTWISTEVDHKTRTIKARCELDNPGGLLRANMFGRVAIQAGENRQALTVPKDAVQWEGCCNIAFVRLDGTQPAFQPVRLTLGFDAGDGYEVLSGLRGGETVVTKGSFILKNEILKSAVGAGCCEVGHLEK